MTTKTEAQLPTAIWLNVGRRGYGFYWAFVQNDSLVLLNSPLRKAPTVSQNLKKTVNL